ncbi:MAG: hypothetical protein KIT84_23895 [Labilithrix sp.]|nr:hypothetical protein [Labilithrix sp.]MCW5814092.1 hypothetical protein [Labilithrix sp.]
MRTRLPLCTLASVPSALGALCMLSVLSLASVARAQGVALSRFEPAPRGSRFFYADSLDLGRADPADTRPLVAAGVAASWAPQLNTWGDLSQGRRNTLVRHTTELHPSASVALVPGARFALSVPVVAYQRGENTSLSGIRYLAPVTPAVGDVRASFDLRFFGSPSRDVNGFAIAGGVVAWLPTGSSAAYASDDFTRFAINLSAAARYRWLLASTRVGYTFRRDAYFGGSRVGPEVNAAAGVAATWRKMTLGPELVASSVIDSELAKRATPVELLVGLHDDVGPLRLGAAVSFALVRGMGTADVRGVFTVEWLGPDVTELRDHDHDGVPDHEDLCPELAGHTDRGGCPPSPAPTEPPPPPEPTNPPPEPTDEPPALPPAPDPPLEPTDPAR